MSDTQNTQVHVAPFDGADYKPEFDHTRLSEQMRRVYDCMKDGVWRTVKEIAVAIKLATGKDDAENSIQAQLRNLRKEKFGKFLVPKRNRGERGKALSEYRLSSPCKLDQPTLMETQHDADKALKYQKKQEQNKVKAAENKSVPVVEPIAAPVSPVEPEGEKYVIVSKTAEQQVAAAQEEAINPSQLSLF